MYLFLNYYNIFTQRFPDPFHHHFLSRSNNFFLRFDNKVTVTATERLGTEFPEFNRLPSKSPARLPVPHASGVFEGGLYLVCSLSWYNWLCYVSGALWVGMVGKFTYSLAIDA